jgi:hypothetical protein
MRPGWTLKVSRRGTDRGKVVYITVNKSATVVLNGQKV